MAESKMEQLIEVLTSLSSVPIETEEDFSETERERYYKQFSAIYRDNFRHWYSVISTFLESQTPDIYSTLENALTWISAYGKKYNPHEDEVNLGIDKLLDHIELESRRIDRMTAVKMASTLTEELYNKTLESAKRAKDQSESAEKNLSHYHEQSIAILGIFSAVVLAFMGGISFSSAVLQNIQTVSMFRLVITLLLLGFIVCNTIFILLRCILHIVCKDEKARSFVGGMIFVNVVLVLVLIATIVVYACGGGVVIDNWGNSVQVSSSEIQSETIDG